MIKLYLYNLQLNAKLAVGQSKIKETPNGEHFPFNNVIVNGFKRYNDSEAGTNCVSSPRGGWDQSLMEIENLPKVLTQPQM